MIDLITGAEKIIINKKKIQYWIDVVETDEYSFRINGWIYIAGIPNWNLETKIDFKGKNHSFSCKPITIIRKDVSNDHGRGRINYEGSGFFIEVPRQNVGPDKYNISFSIKEKGSKELMANFPFLCMAVK